MSALSWETLVNWQGNALLSATTATFTGPSDVSPAPQLQFAANDNRILPGSIFRVLAEGVFSNTGTPNLTLGVYWGGAAGTALATGGAITTITAATNWRWRLEYEFRVTSIGATGSFMGGGMLFMPASLTQAQAAYFMPATAQAAVSVDTTAAKTLTLGATWSASSASNTITVNKFFVESVA